MSEVRVNNLSNENNTGGPTISGITTYSGRHFFVPPQGDTASRPSDCEPGSLRFNTDSAKLEYFRGDTIGWVEMEAGDSRLGGGTGSNTGLGTRGFTAGHHVYGNEIEFITVSTLGNSQDFGDLTNSTFNCANSVCNDTRSFFAGGYYHNVINFWTVASTGNAQDFGDLTNQRYNASGCNDKIRGIFGAGYEHPSHTNIMDYITISTLGNALDYGDLSDQKMTPASVSSSTRAIWTRSGTSPTPGSVMEFTNIRSTGNTTDFGDGYGTGMYGGGSSSTRGIFSGAYIANTIAYITMATTGNTTDFGDLTIRKYSQNNMTSPTRCVHGAGNSYTAPATTRVNVMDYTQIATTGNAVDFGDMTYLTSEQLANAGSNGHGGLSG